jgi:hypothetical protein
MTAQPHERHRGFALHQQLPVPGRKLHQHPRNP